MNRKDLKLLARIRLKDARALLKAGCFDGAYYLAGYVIECALKACIAKKTRRYDFPDKEAAFRAYTHKPATLVKEALLETELVKEEAKDATFRDYWAAVREWTEASRYDLKQEPDARRLLKAISDPKHGVLRWVRQFW